MHYYRSRSNNSDMFFIRQLIEFPCQILRNALSNDGNGPDLWILKGFNGGFVSRAQ